MPPNDSVLKQSGRVICYVLLQSLTIGIFILIFYLIDQILKIGHQYAQMEDQVLSRKDTVDIETVNFKISNFVSLIFWDCFINIILFRL